MLKKLTAAITAILTLCCADVLSVSAADLPDTDPTHENGYVNELASIESSSQKVSPELFEKIKPLLMSSSFSDEVISIYAKQKLMPRSADDPDHETAKLYDEIILTVERETPAYTLIGLFDEDIDQNILNENITELINNENVTFYTNRNSEGEMVAIMNFNDVSDEEIHDISVKTADMLSKNYRISRFNIKFSGRYFEDWELYYNQPFFYEGNLVKITSEEIRNAGVKAEFDPLTGNITHDEGLNMEEILKNIVLIRELTNWNPYLNTYGFAGMPYRTTIDLSSEYLQYRIPDDINEKIVAGVTEIPVVITYTDMSFDKISESYTTEINDYKKLLAKQPAEKYTAEQKKTLLEDYKTKTWHTLVSNSRKNAIKSAARSIGIKVDDIQNYWIEDSRLVCTMTPEQIKNTSLVNCVKSMRLLSDSDDIDRDNQAYYDSFSPVEGDANGDKRVSISDSVRILQYIANAEKYPLSPTLLVNADIADNDGVTAYDARYIQKIDAGLI